jgi:hypothetical protein
VSFFTYRSRKSEVEHNFEESSRLHIDTHWEWPSGMQIHTGGNWVREGLYEPFEVTGTDVVVPTGTYDGWEGALVFNTNRSADLSFDGRANMGSFLSGDRFNASGTVTPSTSSPHASTCSLWSNTAIRSTACRRTCVSGG